MHNWGATTTIVNALARTHIRTQHEHPLHCPSDQVLDGRGTAVWTMPPSAWEKNDCRDPACATDTSGKCEAAFQASGVVSGLVQPSVVILGQPRTAIVGIWVNMANHLARLATRGQTRPWLPTHGAADASQCANFLSRTYLFLVRHSFCSHNLQSAHVNSTPRAGRRQFCCAQHAWWVCGDVHMG